jgi:hypothetical protein
MAGQSGNNGDMMSHDFHTEVEEKNAEMLKQREMAHQPSEPETGYDKADADSFPASDPPKP